MVSSEPFYALAIALKESGFTHHSHRLEKILSGTWTTSSELIHELGIAVIDIRNECKPLTSDHKALLKACLQQVRKVFPGFGLFRWLPFRSFRN